MSSRPNWNERELQELLAGKVLGDLSNDELQNFGELFSAIHAKDIQELELAAAALQLAMTNPEASQLTADSASPENDGLPDFLRQKILNEAERFVSAKTDASSDTTSSLENSHVGRLKQADAEQVTRPKSLGWREAMAWLVAAASIFLAAQLWYSNNSQKNVAASIPTAAESRLVMLNNSQEILRVDWSNGKTPFDNAVTGDVVWSNASQQGFMRFVGMPPNNPLKEQYQLWIIDPDRDVEPIDGGVFDIDSSGEVVVPIHAKLKVLKPAAFAITIEQPGGVVVSTQERLPLLAMVSNSNR